MSSSNNELTSDKQEAKHLSISLPADASFQEKRPTKKSIRGSERMSFAEKRLSRAVTEFLSQRKSITPTPTQNLIISTEIEKGVNSSEILNDKLAPPLNKGLLRRDKKYSKAIEGLEEQRRKSMIQRLDDDISESSDEDLQRKIIRFVDTSKKDDDIFISKDMKLEFKACPKPCERFLKVEDFSEIFVDDIIKEATARRNSIEKMKTVKFVEGFEYRSDSGESSSTESIRTYICLFEWPTITEFTIPLGTNKIVDYLSYWELKEAWKFCVNYLKGESDKACDFYYYEAIFSIPCKQYPIAQATASIYFTIEVSRVKPKNCLVDVYYSFEGKRLIHTPGQYKLQEAWLFHIIDAKLNLFKKLRF